MASWRDRLLGDRDRLGWWTLPVFVLVGAVGAVLAGALAAVYYSQQVNGLEEETREGRAELRSAVTDVQEAGQEALDAIEAEVEQVRDALTDALPVPDAPAKGIASVRAVIGASRSQAPPAQEPAPSGDTAPQGAPAQQPTSEPTPQQTPPPAPQPAQPARPTEVRVGTAFAVATDGTTTFFASSYSLIRDPSAPGGVVETVDLTVAGGTVTAAVHSWDAGRDLAMFRADVGRIELLEWRPSDEELASGERVIAVGVTPTLDTVQLASEVGFTDVTVLVTDLPSIGYLRGAPLVDAEGLVVGVVSDGYAPFGSEAGQNQSDIPVQLLCERMLRNCDALEAQR